MRKISYNLSNLASKEVEWISSMSEKLHCTNPDEPFGRQIHATMKQAFDFTHMTYALFDVESLKLVEKISETVPKKHFATLDKFSHQHPGIAHIGKPDIFDAGSFMTSMPRAEFQQLELYNEMYRHIEVEDQMWISAGNDVVWFGIGYLRDSRFTEKEIAMLTLLNPHARIAWRNWNKIRQLKRKIQILEKDSLHHEQSRQLESSRKLMDQLSPRQRDIAELIAQGLENRKIAETLHISPKNSWKTSGKYIPGTRHSSPC